MNWDRRSAAFLEDSIRLTDDAIRSVRQRSQLLRPTILDDFGLDAGLSWLCEGFMQRTGIEVDYRSSHQSRLPDDTETQLFRSAQEALTNVARHSGATKVTVELGTKNGRIRLRVTDNGKGLGSAEQGVRTFGMMGMRTRARVAGGVFRVTSPESGGLTVDVRIPIPPDDNEESHEPHIRILLADDHAVVRQGFRAILAQQPDMTIVGEAGNGREVLALAEKTKPDLIVMDVACRN